MTSNTELSSTRSLYLKLRLLSKRLDTSTSSFDQDAGSRETSAVSVPFGWVALGVVAARQLVVRTSETTCLIKEREAARKLPKKPTQWQAQVDEYRRASRINLTVEKFYNIAVASVDSASHLRIHPVKVAQ